MRSRSSSPGLAPESRRAPRAGRDSADGAEMPAGGHTEHTERKEARLHLQEEGSEIQSAFIDQVVEQVASAASRIERVEVTEEHGSKLLKEDLDKSIRIISCRQKMNKFADRLEVGWAVVAEYEEDALASNSEDVKKMKKVVERKMAKKRKLCDSKEGMQHGMNYRQPSQQQSLPVPSPLR